MRALHTLKGSARAAGIDAIAELCGPLERYVAGTRQAGQTLPADAVASLGAALASIDEILNALTPPGRAFPDTYALARQLETLAARDLDGQGAGLETQVLEALDREECEPRTFEPEAEADGEGPIESVPSTSCAVDDSDVALPLYEVQTRTQAEPASHEHSQPLAPEPRAAIDAPLQAAAETDTREGAAFAACAAPASEPDLPGEQDQELVDIFLEEASDILEASDEALQTWSAEPQDRRVVQGLQRQLHTLKGGARMAGYGHIGDLSHALESLIIAVVDTHVAPSDALFECLHQSLDRLHGMVKRAERREPVHAAPELIAWLDGLRQGRADDASSASAVSLDLGAELETRPQLTSVEPDDSDGASSAKAAPAQPSALETLGESQTPAHPRASQAMASEGRELVRVRSELLDNLVNNAGEVNIYHARLAQQIANYGFNLNELGHTVARLREQLRKMDIETEAQILFRYEQDKDSRTEAFDPLELDRFSGLQQLSRALGESVNDLVSIKDILGDSVRDTETLLLQQSRVSTDLQDGLMRTRMVRFAGLASRLRRIVRQTAAELGKKVELAVSGESNELDRSLLDRMVAPLEHMLRNAVSHGIESPVQRHARGKREIGRIDIGVAREGNEVIVRVEDDGAGIALEAVRKKARAQGLLEDEDKLSNHDIMQLILESGFSTAEQVTQISGRGVGMDVVNSEIKQLGGILSIDSTQGQGTRFTVRLPFTLAINQALLVHAGEELYAIALASIEGVVRLSAEELKAKYAAPAPRLEYVDNSYELRPLSALLAGAEPAASHSMHAMSPVLLVRSGDQRMALQVDALAGNREIVVKPVGPQISKVRGISGATILGDGRVVLILDLPGLLRIGATAQVSYSEALAPVSRRAPVVMVVDDSITIRKVTARILERHRFAVLTAKDGVDAVSQFQEQKPDLLLLDIEMPRMDGYELATHVRNDEALKNTPIVMITSRTGDKHRERAFETGVDRYLGKPYQESELIETIQALLGASDTRAMSVN